MISKAEFKRMFDTHFDTIRTFIFYRCADADLASDLAQDVFMKVWEKQKQLIGDNLKSLLYKMANDAVISSYRKMITQADYRQSMCLQNLEIASPEEELLFDELVSTYAQALKSMPETQRTVYLMNRNDEMKYREIAEGLEISVKAVEKRMSAALQHLRAELLSNDGTR